MASGSRETARDTTEPNGRPIGSETEGAGSPSAGDTSPDAQSPTHTPAPGVAGGGNGNGPVAARDDPTPWDLYKHVREEIGREWTNITSRIGWLVTSQAFLFAALVAAVQGGAIATSKLFPLLPLIGLVASLAVFLSVWAALRRIKWLRCTQEKLAAALDGTVVGCVDGNGIKSHLRPSRLMVHVFGALPTLFIPVSLLLGWMHVLGDAGINEVAAWFNWSNAVLIAVYLVVVALASAFWVPVVLCEVRDRTNDTDSR